MEEIFRSTGGGVLESVDLILADSVKRNSIINSKSKILGVILE